MPKPKPKPPEKPREKEYILLSKDGTLKVKKSQYMEDMVGTELTDNINKVQ